MEVLGRVFHQHFHIHFKEVNLLLDAKVCGGLRMKLANDSDNFPALLKESSFPRMQGKMFAGLYCVLGNGQRCQQFFYQAFHIVEVNHLIALIPAHSIAASGHETYEFYDFLRLFRYRQLLREEYGSHIKKAQIHVLT